MNSAFDQGARFLEARNRSEAELRRKLKDKGYEQPDIDEAIEKLKDLGYLDDSRFCREYYRYGIGRGLGRSRIERELSEKGVQRETIREAIDAYLNEEGQEELSETDRAWDLAEKLVNDQLSEGKMIDDKFIAKIGRRIASRGFSMDVTYRIMAKVREQRKDFGI